MPRRSQSYTSCMILLAGQAPQMKLLPGQHQLSHQQQHPHLQLALLLLHPAARCDDPDGDHCSWCGCGLCCGALTGSRQYAILLKLFVTWRK
ncbi:hypothetical protein AAY473_034380 [Plecturocebus cupreus]